MPEFGRALLLRWPGVPDSFPAPDVSLDEFHSMVTAAPQMRELFALLEKVAASGASVLLRGETGTGKELAARAIHRLSSRSRGPFRAVNCATLTPELAASELFGHLRGAFTGAVSNRQGLFVDANHGTVFLDEVAELPLEVQSRLLRVLQERVVVPVGGLKPQEIDIRLLTATHKSLRAEVSQRRFREDLMYRIRVVPVFIPPLREREGDVEALAWHFIERFNLQGLRCVTGIERSAHEALLEYSWPGNVRELRNVIEYAFAVGDGPNITVAELPPELREAPHHPPTTRSEREEIEAALEAARGSRAAAATALGISRTTLWRRMRELGMI